MELEAEIKELERRFAEAPESRLFLPLADALRRGGELERAVDLCRKGLANFPDFSAARILLGQCLAGLGRHEDAERIFQDLHSADENNPLVLKQLGNLAGQQGDTVKAREFYDRAFSLDQRDQELVRMMEKLQQAEPSPMESAPVDGQKESTVAPPDTDTGSAGIGDFGDQADAPGEIFITHTLADIYRLQGHYDRALEIYRKLMERGGDEALQRKIREMASRLGEPGVPEPVETGSAAPADDSPLREAFPVAPQKEPEKESPPQQKKLTSIGRYYDPIADKVNAVFGMLIGEQPLDEIPASDLAPGSGKETELTEGLEFFEQWLSQLSRQEN